MIKKVRIMTCFNHNSSVCHFVLHDEPGLPDGWLRAGGYQMFGCTSCIPEIGNHAMVVGLDR